MVVSMSDRLKNELESLITGEAGRLEYTHELALSSFTNDIARIMRAQSVSQAELARRLGVSRARISQLMQHKSSPTLRTMLEVSHALGCRLEVNITSQMHTTYVHAAKSERLAVRESGK
jgi:transcriptional regulator with XRE-family HTH domain